MASQKMSDKLNYRTELRLPRIRLLHATSGCNLELTTIYKIYRILDCFPDFVMLLFVTWHNEAITTISGFTRPNGLHLITLRLSDRFRPSGIGSKPCGHRSALGWSRSSSIESTASKLPSVTTKIVRRQSLVSVGASIFEAEH